MLADLSSFKMQAPIILMIIASSMQVDVSSAFLSPINSGCTRSARLYDNPIRLLQSSTARHALAGDAANEESEDQDDGDVGFTALPAIGASSFWDRPQDEGAYANANDSSSLASPGEKKSIIVSEHTNLVSSKFKIQYTCKVCSTRNSHSVTRVAYRKGLVIAMCKGCDSKHLIADNLGWCGFDFDNGETDIEKYMENRDKESGVVGEKDNDLVMRVNQDVFDLETMLHKGTKGGDAVSAKGTEDGDNQPGDENAASWN